MIYTYSLRTALAVIAPSLGSKKSMSDATKCVKVELGLGTAKLSASNLEQSSTAVIAYRGEDTGTFLIDGDSIKALARLQGLEVNLHLNNEELEIECGRVSLSLPTRDATAFPDLASQIPEQAEWSAAVSSASVEENISSVAHAVGRDIARSALQAIKFESKEGFVKSMATDGHRLSISSVNNSPLPSMLLPSSSIKAIQRSLKDSASIQVCKNTSEEKTLWGFSPNNFGIKGCITVEIDDPDSEEASSLTDSVSWLHCFRLQDEVGFPLIEKVFEELSKGERLSFKVNIKPVRSALALAGMFDKETNKMVITFEDEMMVIRAVSSKGKAEVSLDIIGEPPPVSPDFKFGVNGRYLLEALGSYMFDDECTIHIDKEEGAKKPLLVSQANKKDLIMPMRL